MFLRRCKSIACKAGAVLLTLVILVVPFCGVMVSAEDVVEGVPDAPFTCYYYDLEEGIMVTTPEFAALPQYVSSSTGQIPVQDYIIVKGRDVHGNVAYYAHLFCDEKEPSSVDIEYSFSGRSAAMDDLSNRLANEETMVASFTSFGQAWVEWMTVPYITPTVQAVFMWLRWWELVNERADNAQLHWYTESTIKNEILKDKTALANAYAEFCDDNCHPWLDINLNYADTIQSYILFYFASEGKWQWINSYHPSQSLVYSIVGVESIVSSSFSFAGSTALSGSKNAFVQDAVDNFLEDDLKAPVPSTPSWNQGQTNGGGEDAEGNLNGAFVSGSWYNDAATGNPFVAAFVAPWVGVNWTYENVATEISLFGVSLADILATALVLIAAAFAVTLFVKAVS